jgi:hypothetical protein
MPSAISRRDTFDVSDEQNETLQPAKPLQVASTASNRDFARAGNARNGSPLFESEETITEAESIMREPGTWPV